MSDKDKLTHYRKVFKSDHLGVADLEEYTEEGTLLQFTIKEVKQYLLISGDKNSGVVVAGRRISANIAYFKEKIKPLVLNAGNSAIVKKFAGGTGFIENWKNIYIELYIDPNAKLKGEVVGGVRIRSVQPQKQKPILDSKSKAWENAKNAVSEGNATFESLNKNYTITQENFDLLCG